MKVEEVKELLKPLLDGILTGELPENGEDILQTIIADYEKNGKEDSDSSEWQDKYNNLKEKYINRFFNGEEEDAEEDGEIEEEEVESIMSEGYVLPIHTFAVWKSMGYVVKKGEHAKLVTKLWKMTNKKEVNSEKIKT